MTAPKTILIGDRVCYESAAGIIYGEVVAVEDRLCGDNVLRPWIVVEHTMYNKPVRTSLADTSLAMMKFRVIFRDCTNYEAAANQNEYERMMENA